MWWKVIRKTSAVLSMVISLIFINNGVTRLVAMTTDQRDDFPIFKYMHAIEIVVIGLFFLLVECNSPLFMQNVNIMYKPTPKTILILVFSIFLYTGTQDQLDFYLVISIATVLLLLSFYAKKPKTVNVLSGGN